MYLHRRLSDWRIFYVGKGTGYRHAKRTATQRSPWWMRTAEKHGHRSEIFKDGLSEIEAFEVERQLIASLRLQGHPLVNLTDGGEGSSGMVMPEYAKAKIRDFMRDKTVYTFGRGLDETFIGTRAEFGEISGASTTDISSLVTGMQKTAKGWWFGQPPDTVIRAAMLGPEITGRQKSRQQAKRPVYSSDGCKYPDLSTAAKYGAPGMSRNAAGHCIKKCCEGMMGSYAGKAWSYTPDVPEYISRFKRCGMTQGKRVACSNGMVFYSVCDAARWLTEAIGRNASRGNISNCCNGRTKSYYGHTWRFIDEQ